MATDVTQLIQRLESYKGALKKGSERMRGDMKSMSGRKNRLKGELDGQFARNFYRDWDRTEQAFRAYVDGAESLTRLLDERITALRRLDQAGG